MNRDKIIETMARGFAFEFFKAKFPNNVAPEAYIERMAKTLATSMDRALAALDAEGWVVVKRDSAAALSASIQESEDGQQR